MTILEDYKPYIDRYGLVQDKPGNTSGNGIRYTAEAMYAVYGCNNWDTINSVFLESIKSCQSFIFYSTGDCWYLKRHPEGEPTTVDDYTAALFASWLMDSEEIPNRFLDFGPTQNYIYAPDLNPKFFLGRFQQLFCIANWVAGRKPNKIQEAAWIYCVLKGAFQDGQDEKVLSWMLIRIGQGRRWIFKPLIWFWRKQLKRHYGAGGIGEVLARYYGNPNHPNAKYLKGVGV